MNKIIKNIDKKKNQIKAIQANFKNNKDLLIVDYQKLSVNDFQDLKKNLKKLEDQNLVLKIYKNTLLKKALEKTKMEELGTDLTGMKFVLHTNEKTLETIKILNKFKKEHPTMEFHKGFFDNQIHDQDSLNKLAKIPSREELLIQLVSVFKFAPLKLILTLKELEKRNLEK